MQNIACENVFYHPIGVSEQHVLYRRFYFASSPREQVGSGTRVRTTRHVFIDPSRQREQMQPVAFVAARLLLIHFPDRNNRQKCQGNVVADRTRPAVPIKSRETLP